MIKGGLGFAGSWAQHGVKRLYLKVHAPEEQSTVRPLSHCQKEALGVLGDES